MCIFCLIISNEVAADLIYEDENYIVIKDIHPKAPTHMLLIPKKHISSISEMEDEDSSLIGGLFLLARDLGDRMKIPGYKLQFNVGKAGGQEVMHVHLHFIAG